MAKDVRFLLAIPILEPESTGKFTDPTPVVGVIFVDSTDEDFFVDNESLSEMLAYCDGFVAALENDSTGKLDRIVNIALTPLGSDVPQSAGLPSSLHNALELMDRYDPPQTKGPFQLNFDYSDFLPVRSYLARYAGE
jgi:hypothetical protein